MDPIVAQGLIRRAAIHRSTCCARQAILALLAIALTSAHTHAQSYTYSHTDAIDGFPWPVTLTDSSPFETPDGVEYDNYTGRDTYFDSGYSAVGDSGLISDEAWWGNPTEFGDAEFLFYNTEFGGVNSLAFDFAWAIDGGFLPSVLYVDVEDSDFNLVSAEFDLNSFFSSGTYDGAANHVSINAADLFYEVDEGEFAPLNDIAYVYLYLGDIGTPDSTSEYAIDNLTINSPGGPPEESDLVTPISSRTRYLRGSFNPQISTSVSNDGTGATTFTQSLDPTSDPEFQAQPPISGVPIAAGQQSVLPGGPVGILDKNEPSGEYLAQVRVENDLNPSDPDSLSPFTVLLYDPAVLTDNSGSPIDAVADPVLSIANAAVEPHAGALRAGAEVTAKNVTGGAFGILGLDVGDFVEPAETEMAAVTFNRYGRLTGLHTGGVTVELEMNSEAGSFLNGSQTQPLAPVTWDLEYDLANTPTYTAALATSDQFAEMVGVNTLRSAATLVDGSSSSPQTVSMDVIADPPVSPTTTALLATDAVDVAFSAPGDQYVLQFTYTDQGVPGGLNEADLELIHFNTASSVWELAISSNTDSGAGATMFSGSYADYLGSLGGGAPALSAFGIDTLSNQAWAVLDHASVFGLGAVLVGDPIPGDFNRDGTVDAADYTVWRDNLGAPDESSLNGAGDGLPGVGQGDYALWRNNYGTTASLGALELLPIPEPTAGLLLVLAVACLPRRR